MNEPITAQSLHAQGAEQRAIRLAVIILIAAVGILFLIRMTGHPVLTRHDERMAGYVLDAVQNGDWIVQQDAKGEMDSKPPLLIWCAAGLTWLLGRISAFTIHFPSTVSLAAVSLVLLAAGRRMFGWRAGFFAALACIACAAGYNQLATARYDGMLALWGLLAALAAFRSWMTGRGWIWFWLAATLGTMTKGPLAVVLGGAGLLAAVWEWRSGFRAPVRGRHFAGVLFFFLITGGWLALAYGQSGQPLLDKMIGRELVGHAVGPGDDSSPWEMLSPPIDFVVEFAPWTLPAMVGFWRVWCRPDPAPTLRRFERFLVCAFFSGLLIFCLAGHHRSRLIMPLLPFAALLAGRELSDFLQPWSHRRLLGTTAAALTVYALAVLGHEHFLPHRSSKAYQTLAGRQVARRLTERLGPTPPLTHVDNPFAVQFYLNTRRPTVSFEQAADLLRGPSAAWVVVCDYDRLKRALGSASESVHEVLRWPEIGSPFIQVVSNRATPATNQPVAMRLGPIQIETQSLCLERARILIGRETELTFRGQTAHARLQIENHGDLPESLKIRIFDEASPTAAMEAGPRILPGEVWRATEPILP